MSKPLVVVVESREFPAFADAMFDSLKTEISTHDVSLSRVSVPQLFDLPTAIRMIIEATHKTTKEHWKVPDGFIVSGAGVEGELVNFTKRAIQEISSYSCIATGLGIYTAADACDIEEMEDGAAKHTAKLAVESCVSLMKLKGQLNLRAVAA